MKSKIKINLILLLWPVISLTTFTTPIFGQQKVIVGGYDFPPFVEIKNDQLVGLTLDLIEQINQYQSQYKFIFFLTSSRRRYNDFINNQYDLIMFENIKWDWQDKPVDASKVFLKGGEVYITKAGPGRDQSYFNSFTGKTMSGFLGYHYGFANFNADPIYLGKQFNMILTTSHVQNINTVLLGRIDVGVVTICFLKQYLLHNPNSRDKLLISDKLDQEYQHTILVRKNSKPGVDDIDRLIERLKKSGVLNRLWQKYGINSD